MYKAIVRSQVRRAYRAISAGDMDRVTSKFGEGAVFQMIGSHPLGGERTGHEAIAAWFARTKELFPDLRLEPETILVNGPPWNIRVATRFTVTATLADGGRYENHGMQFLRLRASSVVEDRLYEDTEVLRDAIERQEQALAAPA